MFQGKSSSFSLRGAGDAVNEPDNRLKVGGNNEQVEIQVKVGPETVLYASLNFSLNLARIIHEGS